ncbi:hypothetical protein KCU77_g3289, partial [Aureobasidium melanogenum]
MKSLTADNAPFGKGGYLHQISSATVGPQSSLGKTQAALKSANLDALNTSISDIRFDTVGPQSSFAQAQGHLAKMAALDFISKPLQDLKTSVDKQNADISSIHNATVVPQSSLGKIETAVGSTTISDS